MKQEEIDTLWFKALDESVKQGELYTRYKFAELIVRECIDRINRVGILEDVEFQSDMIAQNVREHFGV